MPAVAQQQVIALAEGRGEIKSINASPRTAPFIPFPANDQSRPVKLAHDSGSHNSDHADVPQQLAFNNDIVGVRIKAGAQTAGDLIGHIAFDLLTLPVLSIQFAGAALGIRKVPRAKKMKGSFGVFEPAG